MTSSTRCQQFKHLCYRGNVSQPISSNKWLVLFLKITPPPPTFLFFMGGCTFGVFFKLYSRLWYKYACHIHLFNSVGLTKAYDACVLEYIFLSFFSWILFFENILDFRLIVHLIFFKECPKYDNVFGTWLNIFKEFLFFQLRQKLYSILSFLSIPSCAFFIAFLFP